MHTKPSLVGSIVSFILQIFGWSMDALGISSMFVVQIPFSLVGLGGSIIFAGFMSWMVWESRGELRRIRDARPNIVLKRIDEGIEGNVASRHYSAVLNEVLISQVEHPNFTRIWIANEPTKTIEEVDAVKLYGEISFYKDGQVLFDMAGRWADKDEIADGGKPIEINQVDLSPNGMPFCFDIGIKYHDEDDFYGYNNDTPRKNTKGFRDADRKLGKGNYHVNVRFRCKGVDKAFWFQLTNNGAGQDVGFVEIIAPPNVCIRSW